MFSKFVNDHYKNKKKSAKDPIQRAIAKLFLNYLYGRLGMKKIDSVMEIVNKTRSRKLG